MAFQEGDTAYIIVNNLRAKQVHIVRRSGEFYIVALSHKCWISIREGRLCRTEEEANRRLGATGKEEKPVRKEETRKVPAPDPGYKTPYEYDNHRSPYGI